MARNIYTLFSINNAKTKKKTKKKNRLISNDSPGAIISVHQTHIRYYNSKCLLIILMQKNQSDFDNVLRKSISYTFFLHLFNFHLTAENSKLHKVLKKNIYIYIIIYS